MITARPPIMFFGSRPAVAEMATIAAIPINSANGTAPTSILDKSRGACPLGSVLSIGWLSELFSIFLPE